MPTNINNILASIAIALALAVGMVATTSRSFAEPKKHEHSAVRESAELANAVRLSTQEIKLAFANVLDTAEVQDSVGTTAVNRWYDDGRFSNEWSAAHGSGKVTGRWRAFDSQRCIIIESGLADRIGKETCAAVYRHGQTYFSLNPDGSIHGKHTLSPLDPSAY